MLPRSAQKMKNFVLSQSQGCSTMTLGTRNHNHIGANHLGNSVAIQLRSKWAANSRGMKTEVFLIQNQTQSRPNQIGRACDQSRYDSHPSSKQYPCRVRLLPHTLVLAGGHIHTRIGMPSASAGMKNASHCTRSVNGAQNAASTTT